MISKKIPPVFRTCATHAFLRNKLQTINLSPCVFPQKKRALIENEWGKGWCKITVRDFDEKTRQKETLKTPNKLVIFASNRSTYSNFHNENRANCTFQRVPAVFRRKKTCYRKWLSNSCTKNQVTPMIIFVNIEDLKNWNWNWKYYLWSEP